MEKQIKTIDVDQMWRSVSTPNACSKYVMYKKIQRKYLHPILDNLKAISKEFVGKDKFGKMAHNNKEKIYYIVESVDRFDEYDLKRLLKKEYTIHEFIYEAYAIRKGND